MLMLGPQYADWALIQEVSEGSPSENVRWWVNEMDNGRLPDTRLPQDYARPVESTGAGGVVQLCTKWRRGGGRRAFQEMFAAWARVLSACEGEDRDIVIGIPVSGRPGIEWERVVGFFVNTLPVRVRAPVGIATATEALLSAFDHTGVGFEEIVGSCTHVGRKASISPLFQVMFSFLERSPEQGRGRAIHSGFSKFDLQLNVVSLGNDRYEAELEYSTEIFKRETAWRLLHEWVKSLQGGDSAKLDVPVGPRDPSSLPLNPSAPVPSKRVRSSLPFHTILSIVKAAWDDVLGDSIKFGLDDDFFSVGGHSLAAMRVGGVLKEKGLIGGQLRILFESRTIRALAKAIHGGDEGTTDVNFDWIWARDGRIDDGACREGPLSLSAAQERMWVLSQDGSATYNMPAAIWDLDMSAEDVLREVEEVVARHEILRTVYKEVDGELCQVVVPRWPGRLRLIHVHNFQAFQDLANTEARKGLDLATEGPLRVIVVATGLAVGLIVVQHHISGDGFSTQLLLREIFSESGDHSFQPGEETRTIIHYADYAQAERQSERDGPSVNWWKKRLDDGRACGVTLPADGVAPSGAGFVVRVGVKCKEGVGFSEALLAWGETLAEYEGEEREEIVVGVPMAGRYVTGSERLVGMFVNTIPVPIRLNGRPIGLTDVLDVGHIGLEEIVAVLEAGPGDGLFSTLFSWSRMESVGVVPNGEWIPVHSGRARLPISLSIVQHVEIEEQEWLEIEMEVDAGLFRWETAEAILFFFLNRLANK